MTENISFATYQNTKNYISKSFHYPKLGFFAKIRDMWRYIQVWRFISFIAHKKLNDDMGITRDEFIKQVMEGKEVSFSKEWIVKNYQKDSNLTIQLLNTAIELGRIKELPSVYSDLITITTTSSGDYYGSGWTCMVEGFLKEFNLQWTLVVVPLITFVIGVYGYKIVHLFVK